MLQAGGFISGEILTVENQGADFQTMYVLKTSLFLEKLRGYSDEIIKYLKMITIILQIKSI
jgi:hypothetical protein